LLSEAPETRKSILFEWLPKSTRLLSTAYRGGIAIHKNALAIARNLRLL
jgi:hypothetical protein